MSGKNLRNPPSDNFQKLQKLLTYPKVVKSINEGKFKEYVDDVQKFKIDNQIDGFLRNLIPEGVKGNILTLANKFDIFIPPGGELNRQEIDAALISLYSNKGKLFNKLNEVAKNNLPRADTLLGSDKSISGGGVDVEEREMNLRGSKTEEEEEKEDIAESIVNNVVSESVDKDVSEDVTKVVEEIVDEVVEQGKVSEKQQKIKEIMDTGVTEKEANEIFDNLEAEIGTQVGREMMMGKLGVPTAEEEIKQGQEAVRKAKEERPETGMTPEEEADLVGVNPNLADVPSASTSVSDMKPSKNVDLKVSKRPKTGVDIEALPTKAELIPKIRLSTRGKDIKELIDDINYFLTNFKSQLKKEKDFFSKVDKKNISQLRELHGRIVGKLQPNLPPIEKDKKVGVIINADEYIREQMKKILNESMF